MFICSLFILTAYESNSGQVYLGTWNNAQVALKVFATEAGITPSSTVRLCSVFFE